MTSWRTLLTRTAAITVVAALALVNTTPAYAATYEPITGSGSTWSQNALDQWRANVKANYGMTINYSGTGSTAGRQEFILGTVDFAVSEIPFQSAPVHIHMQEYFCISKALRRSHPS